MDIENMNIEKATERCNQLIKPEHANWIGISNQIAIKTVLSELERLQNKENIEFGINNIVGEKIKRISTELCENTKDLNNDNINEDKEIKLDYITFKQFFYTVNIRYIKCNRIIKIFYNEDMVSKWIQLGWNDFNDKLSSWNLLNQFLKPEILNSYVTDICYNDEEEILEIYLENNPMETLEEYNS